MLETLKRGAGLAACAARHWSSDNASTTGAALGAGLLLSLIANKRQVNSPASNAAPATSLPRAGARMTGLISESMAEIKGALIGVAVTHAKSVISKLIPGFEEQLARGTRSPPNSIHRT